MRAWLLSLVIAGCGRWNFDFPDASGDGGLRDDGLPAPLDGMLTFDAPTACVPDMAPSGCTTAATGVTDFAVGSAHVCVIRNDQLVCWGRNDHGGLGLCIGAPNVLAPRVSVGLPIASLALGERHTCARLVDGQGWCWGSQFEGETGTLPSTIGDPIPHRVGGTWRELSSMRFHTCGIASDGSLWCWGRNDSGELGVGDQTDRYLPEQVGTDVDWLHVAAGGTHTCALKTDGRAFCWGTNADADTLPPVG